MKNVMMATVKDNINVHLEVCNDNEKKCVQNATMFAELKDIIEFKH
jgi:hypothetical protein